MATRIIEYGGRSRSTDFPVVPTRQQLVVQSPITASSSPASSSAFNNGTSLVCVQSDEAVYVAFGSAPTATTSDYRIQAGQEQFFDVAPGHKVSVRT